MYNPVLCRELAQNGRGKSVLMVHMGLSYRSDLLLVGLSWQCWFSAALSGPQGPALWAVLTEILWSSQSSGLSVAPNVI
jgi:hypothetical protein